MSGAGPLDVAIVGSGLGGLTAAALLARHGLKVEVFERHYLAGGYATTFTRSRNALCFDVSLHGLGGLGRGGLVRKNLELCDVWRRLSFSMPAAQSRSMFPRHDIRVPQCDVEGYVQRLSGCFPAEAAGLRRLVREIFATYEQFDLAQARHFKDFCRNVRAYALLVKYSRLSLAQMLAQFIGDEACAAIVTGQWSYHGVPPSRLPAISFVVSWVEYMVGGSRYPVGNSQTIVGAFQEAIEEHGGRVRLRSGVERILVEDGRARGVVLRSGEAVRANVVIANANPYHVVHELIGAQHFPSAYVEQLATLKPSLSSFLVFLGLEGNVRDTYGITDYELVLSPSYDLEAQYRHCRAGRVDESEVTVTIPSNLGPASPAGTALTPVNVSTLCGMDVWRGLSRPAYQEQKDRLTDRVLARLDTLMPGLRDKVVLTEASTPLTNVRYTRNREGALYGFEKDIRQFSKVRTMSRTPIENLYLSSAWAFPGGGYSGAIWAGYFCVFENDLLESRLDVLAGSEGWAPPVTGGGEERVWEAV